MTWSEAKTRHFWRTNFPWIIIIYILVFAFLRIILSTAEKDFALNLLLAAAFTSYIFLFIFYIFGVRPLELEHHFRK